MLERVRQHRWFGAGLRGAIGTMGVLILTNQQLSKLKEPVAEGKTISFWLDQLTNQNQHAEAAIATIGPQAIPFLLWKARHREQLRDNLYRNTWLRLPRFLKTRLPLPKVEDEDLNRRIALALARLGPAAAPMLIASLDDRNANVRQVAVWATTGTPPAEAAVSHFVKLLKDPQSEVRFRTVVAIDQMRTGRLETIPALIEALKDNSIGSHQGGTSTPICEVAARVLGEIGPKAQAAVPGLIELLKSPSNSTRREAAVALAQITRDPDVMVSVILELEKAPDAVVRLAHELDDAARNRNSGDPRTCQTILNAFGKMGRAARPATLLIANLIRYPNTSWSDAERANVIASAREALAKIDEEAAQDLEAHHH